MVPLHLVQGVEQPVVGLGLDLELVPPGLLAAELRVVAADLDRQRDLPARAAHRAIGGVEHVAQRLA